MPYKSIEELPKQVEGLPSHAKEIFMKAFNASYNEYGEERAFKIAWAAVKNSGYSKNKEGEWVKAERSINIIESPIMFKIPDGKKFTKEIIYEGKFVHPNDKRKVLDMSIERFNEWINNFKKKLVDIVYVPLNHSDNPEDNTGIIEDMWIGNSDTIPGKKALFAKFNIILDSIASKIGKTILGCSLGAERYVSPETGEDLGEIISHVALTNDPYIPHLGEFREVAFSKSENVLITNYVFEKESEGKKEINMDKETLELKEKMLEMERKLKEAEDKANMSNREKDLLDKKVIEMEKTNFEREVTSEIDKLVLSKKVFPADKEKEVKFAISLGKDKGIEYIRDILAKRQDLIDTSTKMSGNTDKNASAEEPKLSELNQIWKNWLEKKISKEKAFELCKQWEEKYNLAKNYVNDSRDESIKFKRTKTW